MKKKRKEKKEQGRKKKKKEGVVRDARKILVTVSVLHLAICSCRSSRRIEFLVARHGHRDSFGYGLVVVWWRRLHHLLIFAGQPFTHAPHASYDIPDQKSEQEDTNDDNENVSIVLLQPALIILVWLVRLVFETIVVNGGYVLLCHYSSAEPT